MYATNYIRVIGDSEKPGAGRLFFFNDNDLGQVSTTIGQAKAHLARVGGPPGRGRIASFRPTGDPAIQVIGEVREPLDIKAEAADRADD